MEQLVQYFSQWSARQKMAAGLGILGMVGTLVVMFWLILSPRFTLLYSGLDASASGDVLAALEQQNIPFEIRGDAIFVPHDRKDALRMALAAQGLPKASVQGYELLDGLSGFSTTSQMFDAAYWRAKEGELARTIMVSPHITSARVHISHTPTFSFGAKAMPKASVSIVTAHGGLGAQHATALRYLVSSAVAGLDPKDVAIIDEETGLVADPNAQSSVASAFDKSLQMQSKIERLLEPHLGVGNAVVEVSVETETETKSIRQKTVDPKSRVAISTQTIENAQSTQNSGTSAVSVASNVPDGQGNNQNGSQTKNNELRETTNYEISQTESEILKTPGDIKRISVAVAVNQSALGREVTPQRIEQIESLVASAVGLMPSRGDIVTVEVLEFQPIVALPDQTTGVPSWFDRLDVTQIVQVVIVAMALVLIGLFVVRPLFRQSQNVAFEQGQIALNTAQQVEAIDQNPGPAALPHSATERLRQMIGERQTDTVEILRTWLEERKS